MKTFIASVKDLSTKEIILITSTEYTTKKDFAKDLKGGYSVRFIATEESFDEECEKFYAKQEYNRTMANIRYNAKKETKRMMNESTERVNAMREEERLQHRKDNFITEECANQLMKMYANMGMNVTI